MVVVMVVVVAVVVVVEVVLGVVVLMISDMLEKNKLPLAIIVELVIVCGSCDGRNSVSMS